MLAALLPYNLLTAEGALQTAVGVPDFDISWSRGFQHRQMRLIESIALAMLYSLSR